MTVQNTIETLRLQEGVEMWQKESLTGVVINQGKNFFFGDKLVAHRISKVLSDMGMKFTTLIFHLSDIQPGLCLLSLFQILS